MIPRPPTRVFNLSPDQKTRRAAQDISELNLPKRATIVFPEGRDKLLHFEISLKPDEGYYACVVLGLVLGPASCAPAFNRRPSRVFFFRSGL